MGLADGKDVCVGERELSVGVRGKWSKQAWPPVFDVSHNGG